MQQTRYDIQCAAVIGAGTMGRGIAMSLASAGIEVLWLDKDAQMLEQALGVVADTFAHNVRQGRIDEGEAAARRQRIRPVAGYADLAEVDLVIEAVYENLALKQAIFGELDGVVRAGAILASNTSALDIDA
ncbi:MAG: 3-hydroxyacyl-CoA dehydrogenase family protein, partial [Stutzerimonas sp.]|uniref:3-hydroxyacyl-CoA dehydrogenase family protein n=1 Tax=Stutzerimonas sp. TaxID=2901166 RepID=UPI003D0BCFB9